MALVAVMLPLLLGCKVQGSGYDQIVDELGKLRNEVDGLLSDPQRSVEEFKKLSQYEYQILELTPDQDWKGTLDAAGKERWNCFHVENHVGNDEQESTRTLVFCKRQPYTPLRVLAR